MSPTAADPDISLLPAFRALVECHATVGRASARYIEATGLTPSQFDVLVALGDLPGLTCSELGRRTLITKGTLTPVIDRLEARGLVHRERGADDHRQVVVALTPAGQAEYERVFYPHVALMRAHLDRMPPDRQDHLIALLAELRAAFS